MLKIEGPVESMYMNLYRSPPSFTVPNDVNYIAFYYQCAKVLQRPIIDERQVNKFF